MKAIFAHLKVSLPPWGAALPFKTTYSHHSCVGGAGGGVNSFGVLPPHRQHRSQPHWEQTTHGVHSAPTLLAHPHDARLFFPRNHPVRVVGVGGGEVGRWGG
jgi:hypothetical protein